MLNWISPKMVAFPPWAVLEPCNKEGGNRLSACWAILHGDGQTNTGRSICNLLLHHTSVPKETGRDSSSAIHVAF